MSTKRVRELSIDDLGKRAIYDDPDGVHQDGRILHLQAMECSLNIQLTRPKPLGSVNITVFNDALDAPIELIDPFCGA